MIIYPAIDLKSGQCVRLYQGCYDQMTLYEETPINFAKLFTKQGAKFLHVVDLDGAKEARSVNLSLIIKIKQETGLLIQTGGGIRSKQQVCQMLQCGIDRIILGSIAITEVNDVKKWIAEFGFERIVLALDIRLNKNNEPMIAIHGWQTSIKKTLWQLLDEYQGSALRHVLCTDIQRDGTLLGPNIALYKECAERYPSLAFQASGGISTLNDLLELSKIPISGAIVGKALYENKFSMRDALNRMASC